MSIENIYTNTNITFTLVGYAELIEAINGLSALIADQGVDESIQQKLSDSADIIEAHAKDLVDFGAKGKREPLIDLPHLGRVTERRLNYNGVTTFAQVAEMAVAHLSAYPYVSDFEAEAIIAAAKARVASTDAKSEEIAIQEADAEEMGVESEQAF